MRQLLIAIYLDDDANEDELVAQLAELDAIPGVVLHRLEGAEILFDDEAAE